jgi:hypothetical protein
LKSFISLVLLFFPVVDAWAAPRLTYDQLYPYYVEACTLSQIKEKIGNQVKEGGIAGHMVLYLKGVCRDTRARYPQVRVCEAGPTGNITDPDGGTLISVDKQFRNVNWVAIEGKTLSIRGGLDDVSKLTRERWAEVAAETAGLGVFRGIELHPDAAITGTTDDDVTRNDLSRKGETDERTIARKTIGTDYALNFARAVYCARVPVPLKALDPIVRFLNERNRRYAEPTSPDYRNFRWSGIYNNCAHTSINALAAAGIMEPIPTHRRFLGQVVTGLAIPSREFVRVAEVTTDPGLQGVDLGRPSTVIGIARLRALFLRYSRSGWLPIEAGGVIEHFPHRDNAVYAHTDFPLLPPAGQGAAEGTSSLRRRMIVRFLRPAAKRAREITTMPRYTDLVANLKHYEKMYANALGSLRRAGSPAHAAQPASGGHANLDVKYRDYLQARAAWTRKTIALLEAQSP